jgi:hypothetical protein
MTLAALILIWNLNCGAVGALPISTSLDLYNTTPRMMFASEAAFQAGMPALHKKLVEAAMPLTAPVTDPVDDDTLSLHDYLTQPGFYD